MGSDGDGLELTSDELKELGSKAFSEKNFKLALEHYSKAVELSPESHVLYSNRSATHASLQQWQAALEDADKCISLKPDWARGHGRRGAAYEGLGERIQAKAAYEAGLALDPSNAALAAAVRSLTMAQRPPMPRFVNARPVRPPQPEGLALWLNYATVSTTILYLFPVLGAKGAFYAYRACLFASLAKYALQLYRKFGLSRQVLSQWDAIKTHESAHYFALCAMLLFWRPVPFVLVPNAATSMAVMVPALVTTVHALPSMLQKLVRERVDQIATDEGYMLITAFAATSEVMVCVSLLLACIASIRNVPVLLFYVRFLTWRYAASDMTKQAVWILQTKLQEWCHHKWAPRLVGICYEKASMLISTYLAPKAETDKSK